MMATATNTCIITCLLVLAPTLLKVESTVVVYVDNLTSVAPARGSVPLSGSVIICTPDVLLRLVPR